MFRDNFMVDNIQPIQPQVKGMEIKSLQKLLWTASAGLNLLASCCNLVKKSLLPLFPLINVECHENWLLAAVTLNNMEKGGGG